VAESVFLGEITCPCGQLVLMDGGYLGLWSGSRPPEEVRAPDIPPSVDFEVVGPDAEAAARLFDRQSGRTLYDIPVTAVDAFRASFDEAIRGTGLDASLRAFDGQVPHRERARRAITSGDKDFLISGVGIVAVGGLPTDRPMRVTATPDDGGWGWAQIRILVSDASAVRTRMLGPIGIDYARFAFADADALGSWEHERPVDGLADVVFWGRDAEAVAEQFGALPTGTPGEGGTYGWLDLPVEQANARAVELTEAVDPDAGRWVRVDFRPHSHHWQVMAGVRAAEHEAATIDLAGARVMFAMTSVGDGFFPVDLELDASGTPVAIQITVTTDDEGEAEGEDQAS
jgi:hypothetical protein